MRNYHCQYKNTPDQLKFAPGLGTIDLLAGAAVAHALTSWGKAVLVHLTAEIIAHHWTFICVAKVGTGVCRFWKEISAVVYLKWAA